MRKIFIVLLCFTSLYLNAQHAEDFYLIGNMLAQEGNHPDALKAFEKSAELDPTNPKTFYNIGLTYYFLEELDSAIVYISQAIVLDPYYTYAYQNRAELYGLKGMYAEAIDDLDMVINAEPNVPAHLFNRALYKRNSELYQEALEDYSAFIDMVPDVMAAYRNRGTIYGKVDLHEKALADYDMVIWLHGQGKGTGVEIKNLSGDFFNRGVCRLRLGYDEDGCSDLNKAQALGYNVGPILTYCD